eukprot:CAMPEP_0179104160 /NCGR_PEP_ID=MMETSP0796-20121207/48302_1 /TAXON_ID=73915 /ORGANISM="Pyrodinium bahamense, Strain pbaha01" /LENGTH=215 /DNA_ID=CAMNT_0020802093 /DNA_START=147 /DNA_END=794 /DNA_ORIENTATION=+
MRAASATIAVVVGLTVAVSAAEGFVAGISSIVQRGCSRRTRLRAEEEADPQKGLMDSLKDTLKVTQETRVDGAEFETPWDGLFGLGKGNADGPGDDFVDSSDEANYVTVILKKPLGIGLAENAEEGGLKVTEIQPGSNAEASGKIKPGYQLIVADGKPVYGLPTNEIVQPIAEKDGPVMLTFFTGKAEHFYGKLGPSSDWLTEFLQKLREETDEV